MLPDFVFLQDLIAPYFCVRVTNITYCNRLDHLRDYQHKQG